MKNFFPQGAGPSPEGVYRAINKQFDGSREFASIAQPLTSDVTNCVSLGNCIWCRTNGLWLLLRWPFRVMCDYDSSTLCCSSPTLADNFAALPNFPSSHATIVFLPGLASPSNPRHAHCDASKHSPIYTTPVFKMTAVTDIITLDNFQAKMPRWEPNLSNHLFALVDMGRFVFEPCSTL